MLVIEQILDEIARTLGLDALDVRRVNFYGVGDRDTTHYGQTVEHNVIHKIVDRLVTQASYVQRRQAVDAANAADPIIRRGLALTPVKFGISFTSTPFNQAGALLHVYADGTVLLNHGGTEMGQGLFTKVAQVVAAELGLPLSAIRVSATDTAKVPNTSATAASSSSDLNGKAAQAAAQTIRQRLVQHACDSFGVEAQQIRFDKGRVKIGERDISFGELAQHAFRARISLSATGYYRTPKIQWDKATLRGRPFFYFAFGAAISEVAVDSLTGETQLLRVDILHDAGTPLNAAIDLGQIEGGFLQGVGWLTSEELWWNDRGELRTYAPSTYKIPTARDWPAHSTVQLLDAEPNREDTIYRSKAVGEPPLMLSISVLHAIRDAVASCGPAGALPMLCAPATPEAVLRAIDGVRAGAGR
ncbi:MAG TPA: molybdopterin cofactor-binding domain-containing protein, partial [Steroidobacteraceae bacterium]